MCRAEARDLYAAKAQFDALGCKLTCVLKENIESQVTEFSNKFWPAELYLDEQMSFFRVLGGGKLRKGNLLQLLNPWSTAYVSIGEAKKSAAGLPESNFTGEGKIMGGLFVMKPGERGVQYQFGT